MRRTIWNIGQQIISSSLKTIKSLFNVTENDMVRQMIHDFLLVFYSNHHDPIFYQ